MTHSRVVAGADYYPFGLPMDGREITDEPYRWGYQGQYAQENDSAGWNEFQLRMYDARFGRWLSPDPYGQFASPYLGMGNAPNMGVDPDGGWNWMTAAIGFGVGALAGYVATGDWEGALVGGLAGGLIGGASFRTDPEFVSAGSQTGGFKVLEKSIVPSSFGKSIGSFAANYGDDILLASTRAFINLELRGEGLDEIKNGWLHNYADPKSFNLEKIGDAFYTNILPDDQHYALIYGLFPPRMRVVDFVTPSLYIQVPARSFGKFLGTETAQLSMAKAWDMGRSSVMAHMRAANINNQRAMKIFLDGFRNGLRVHFGGTTAVSVTPFSGSIPKTDVQYKNY